MNTTVFSAIHNLAISLDEYFKQSPFIFKSSESNTTFSPALPSIYEFCIPPKDKNQYGYPCNSPAIAIVVDEMSLDGSDIVAKISFHIAVCNPSTTDAETVIGNNQLGYQFKEGSGYGQDGAYTDLYAACLHLGEEVLTAIGSIANSVRIDDLVLTTPEVDFPDYPYANCVITGTYKYLKSYRSVNSSIAQLL